MGGIAYPQMAFTVLLRRHADSYEQSDLLTVVLLVFLAWIACFIDRKIDPARTGMLTVCFLTLNNRAQSITSDIPRAKGSVWIIQYVITAKWFIVYTRRRVRT